MKYNSKLFFDTHAHYNHIKFSNIQNMLLNNLKNIYILNVGYDIKSSYDSVLLANKYKNIYAAVGIHPSYITSIKNNDLNIIKNIIKENKKVIAIGEIGLDIYDLDNYIQQKEIFVQQLNIAYENNLPIILHIRDLYYECLEIIDYYKISNGIIHCFSSTDINIVKKFIDKNFFISFSGNITFKKFDDKNFNEIINFIPNDKILLETDSPYLSPNPFRGKINTSFNIKYIAERIANIKNKKIIDIYNLTMSNAFFAFNI